MDKLKALYDSYIENGLISNETTFEQFSQANDEQLNSLYNQGLESSILSSDTSVDLFKTAWNEKKKAGSQLESVDLELETVDISPEITEEDYFTGGFGDALRGFDSIVPLGLGDWIDDMARGVASGYYQGVASENAADLLLRGSGATEEDIYSYIEANKNAQKYGSSAEMQEYQKIYEENGSGFWGVVKGIASTGGTILPELIVSSMTSMASNTDALAAGGAAVATGATYGGVTGAAAGGVGAVPGAIAGAAASIPYAFGAASTALEMGATFSELLQEELGDSDMSSENVRDILEDPEKMDSIRNKAIARGVTIGVIDAFTGKLAGGVGAKVLTKGGAAASAASKARKIGSVAAAGGVEAVGGSTGEATARLLIGQDMDISEIALEGLAEVPGGIKDIVSARFSKPTYKINGEKVNVSEINNVIDNFTLEQIQSTKIDMKNDYTGLGQKLQDRIVQLSTEKQILDANPEINNATLKEITALQLELDKLEGNKTEVGKEKASLLRSKIKDLQENQLEAEVEAEVDVTQADATTDVKTDVDAFRELEQDDQLKYIDQASKELVEESEAKGDEEFEITEEQNLERAVDLFKKDQQTDIAPEVQEQEFVNTEEDINEYNESIASTKSSDPVKYWSVSIPDTQEVSTSTIIKTEDGSTIVKKDGDIAGLFKTPEAEQKGVKGVAQSLLKKAIEAGGKKLDNFDGYLTNQYKKAGFRVVARTPFNEEFAPDGWSKEQHSTPDVVAMVYDPEGKLDFEEKMFEDSENGYDQMIEYRDQILAQTEAVTEAEVVTEQEFPSGYDRVKTEIDGIIEKTKARKTKSSTKPSDIFNNTLNYLQGTKVYEQATDVQREQMVRELREKVGLTEKKAPTPKAAIKKAISKGIIKGIQDATKITITESQAIIQQIKALNRGAKDAVKAIAKTKKQLTSDIKDLVKKGKVSTNQMATVISKLNKTKMLNPVSVERFVDYMAKVFNNAEYASIIENANKKRNAAKKNASTKIGIAEGLVPQLQRLFSVNPTLIPDAVLDKYSSLVNMFSKRQTVLALPSIDEVTKITEDVLQQLDEEQSMAIELADRFDSAEKVINDEGKVDYAATIKSMLDNDQITEEEFEVMKKYKSQIYPAVKAEPKTQEEIDQERAEVIEDINNIDEINTNELPSQEERALANTLKKLIKSDAINELSLPDLNNLFKLIDNINNGYLPHFAQVMVEKLNAIEDGKIGAKAIERSKLLPFSKIYSRIKSLITKKGSIQEMIRRNPLFNIDQIFGDFKTKDIFNSLFGRAAEASANMRKELKSIQDKITKAEQAVNKSFKRDSNKFVMSKYKQMAYLIQQEFLSNPNNKQVNDISEFLKATIKRIDEGTTRYSELDAEMLQEVLDTYTDSNGNFDNVALYESFNKAEKNSIKVLEDINKSLGPKAVYTSTIIRGEKISPLKNYTHLSVIPDSKPSDVMGSGGVSEADNFSARSKPSTKAKSLIERTGKVSPLNFDVYASVQRGSKQTLMDYHLTEPIRTSRRTLNQIEKNLSGDSRMPSDLREKFNAIRSAFEEATENLLTNSFTETSITDDVMNYLQKQGYRSILAGTGRFVAELTSNLSFAMIVDPKGFIAGTKLRNLIGSPKAPAIMSNLNSKQTNRIFPNEDLSGKMLDVNILNQATGVKGGKAKSKVNNIISKGWNKTGQRWIKGVEFVADSLISTPDKLIMQPMWFGAFENKFKEITGKSPDFDKIATNDEAYMKEFESALSEAKDLADNRSVMAGATDNAFMGMLKGTSKPNQSVSLKAFNAFNNFMTRFLIFEYVTARTGVMNLIGKGDLSKKQGAALIGGVTSRMVLYTLLGQVTAEAMSSMFEEEDDEIVLFEDDQDGLKSPDKMLGQAFASAFSSLLFGRDFGNATKSVINYAVEEFNKQQLDFLREGDYDPFKDGIQYTIVPKSKPGRGSGLADFLMKMGAAYGPILGTADLLVKKLTEPERKESDAIKRQEGERFVRLPLEILGNLGFIPLYKDIRKVVLSNLYGDLTRAQKLLKEKKQTKKEMLQGYDSESDMKRYNLPLWEKTYGPDSQGYDERQAAKEIAKQKRKIRQQLKDEMYDYTPPSKRGKRKSSGFGPGKKRKSRFGPKK